MIFIDERYSINIDMEDMRENKIYNAFDRLNDEPVIIKLLRVTSKIKNDFIRNMIDISTSINEKKPIGVLRIKNIGEYELVNQEKYIYIVYENIIGVTLSNIMAGNYLNKNTISNIAMGIFKSLSNMENNFGRKNGYHGSLRADDIIVDKNCNIKVADFGITAANDGKNIEADGNIEYMSLFQLGINYTDHQSDVFAAGVIIYEMIFGQKPFKSSENKKEMLKNMNRTPEFKFKIKNKEFNQLIELDKRLLDIENNDIGYDSIISELIDITLNTDNRKRISENSEYEIIRVNEINNKTGCKSNQGKTNAKIIIFMVIVVLIIINTIYFVV